MQPKEEDLLKFLKTLSCIEQCINEESSEARGVAYTPVINEHVGIINVSTVYTYDEGYETAVIYKKVSPVERYSCKLDAEEGHKKWCKKIKTATEVTDLGGMGGLVPASTVVFKM